jgi:serine/threonine protein kinase
VFGVRKAQSSLTTPLASQMDALNLQQVQVGRRRVAIRRGLAEGGFAFIYLAEDTAGGELMVLKKMVTGGNDHVRAAAAREVSLLQKYQHPNVVRLFDAAQTGTETLLLMEFCPGGNLLDLLQATRQSRQLLPESTVLRIFKDVLSAVAFLHSHNVAHRDLKLENILCAQDRTWKLCDFGSAVVAPVPLETAQQRADEQVVIERTTTQLYRAPEMADIYVAAQLDTKVDVWALGCILYSLAYLKHPFQGEGNLAIINARISLPENSPYSANLNALIMRMLTANPQSRSSADELVACLMALESGSDIPPPVRLSTDAMAGKGEGDAKGVAGGRRRRRPGAPAMAGGNVDGQSMSGLNPNSVAARRLNARAGGATSLALVDQGNVSIDSSTSSNPNARTAATSAHQEDWAQFASPSAASGAVAWSPSPIASSEVPADAWGDFAQFDSVAADATPGSLGEASFFASWGTAGVGEHGNKGSNSATPDVTSKWTSSLPPAEALVPVPVLVHAPQPPPRWGNALENCNGVQAELQPTPPAAAGTIDPYRQAAISMMPQLAHAPTTQMHAMPMYAHSMQVNNFYPAGVNPAHDLMGQPRPSHPSFGSNGTDSSTSSSGAMGRRL